MLKHFPSKFSTTVDLWDLENTSSDFSQWKYKFNSNPIPLWKKKECILDEKEEKITLLSYNSDQILDHERINYAQNHKSNLFTNILESYNKNCARECVTQPKVSESLLGMEKLTKVIEQRSQERRNNALGLIKRNNGSICSISERRSPTLLDSGIGTNQSKETKRLSQSSFLFEENYLCRSMINLGSNQHKSMDPFMFKFQSDDEEDYDSRNQLNRAISSSSHTLITQSYSDLLDIPTPYYRGRMGPKMKPNSPIKNRFQASLRINSNSYVSRMKSRSKTIQLIERLFSRKQDYTSGDKMTALRLSNRNPQLRVLSDEEEYFGSRLTPQNIHSRSSITLLESSENLAEKTNSRPFVYYITSSNNLIDGKRIYNKSRHSRSRSSENIITEKRKHNKIVDFVKIFRASSSNKFSKDKKCEFEDKPIVISLCQASKVHVTRLHSSLAGGRQFCVVVTGPPGKNDPQSKNTNSCLVSAEEMLVSRVLALRDEVECLQFIKSISRTAHPNRKQERRLEKNVRLSLQEAKNLHTKSFNLPDIQTMTVSLYRQPLPGKITRRGSLSSILTGSHNASSAKRHAETDSSNTKTRSELIGYVTLPLHTVPQQRDVKTWVKLRPANRGLTGFNLTHQLQMNNKSGLWDYVECLPTSTESEEMNCPLLRLNIQFTAVDVLPQFQYLGLQTFVLEKTLELTRFLEQILQTSSKEPIAKSLVYLHEYNSTAVECITQLIFSEVAEIQETAMLFRQNTFATKTVDHFMKLVSGQYLQLLLGDLIKRITSPEYAWTWEVDPDRLVVNTPGCTAVFNGGPGARGSSITGRNDTSSWTLLSDNNQGTAPWAERVIRSYCELSSGNIIMALNRQKNSNLQSAGSMHSTKLIMAQQLSVASLTDGIFQIPNPASNNNLPLIANQCQLLQFLDLAWRGLQLSLPDFPSELILLFGSIRATLEPIRGPEFCDILISSCLFLRLICPAILAPSLFHLLPSYPSETHVQRNLTLLAKALQTLANFMTMSDKEPFMRYLKAYIECQIPKMRTFIRLISSTNQGINFHQSYSNNNVNNNISQSYSTTSTSNSTNTNSSSSLSQKLNQKSGALKSKHSNERGAHVDQIDTGFELAQLHENLWNVFFSELPKELITLPELLTEIRSHLNPSEVLPNHKSFILEESWTKQNSVVTENLRNSVINLAKGDSNDEIFLVTKNNGVKMSNSLNELDTYNRSLVSQQIYAIPQTIKEVKHVETDQEMDDESHVYDLPYFGIVGAEESLAECEKSFLPDSSSRFSPISKNTIDALPRTEIDLNDRESPIYDSVPNLLQIEEDKTLNLSEKPNNRKSATPIRQSGTRIQNQKRSSPMKNTTSRRTPTPSHSNSSLGAYLPISSNKRLPMTNQQYYSSNNNQFLQTGLKQSSQRYPILSNNFAPVKSPSNVNDAISRQSSSRPFSTSGLPVTTTSLSDMINNSSSPSQRSSIIAQNSSMNLSMLMTTPVVGSSSQSDLSENSSLSFANHSNHPSRSAKAVSSVVIRNRQMQIGPYGERKPRLSIPEPPPLTASIEKELPQISQLREANKNSSNFQTLEQALVWFDEETSNNKGLNSRQSFAAPERSSNLKVNLSTNLQQGSRNINPINRRLTMPGIINNLPTSIDVPQRMEHNGKVFNTKDFGLKHRNH